MSFVTGQPELVAALRDVGLKVEKKMLRQALRAGGRVIAEDAKARAPVRTDAKPKRMKDGVDGEMRRPGFLRRMIRVRMRIRRNKVIAIIGTTAKAFYAIFLEFGTRHQSPEPFLRPAADSKAGEAVSAIGNSLRDQLRDYRFKESAGG